MQRKGTVAAINSNRGMVAIATEDDAYTIIELLSDWDIEVGDEIRWKNGYGLGSEIYFNLTQNVELDVVVQNHSVSRSILRQQLLLA